MNMFLIDGRLTYQWVKMELYRGYGHLLVEMDIPMVLKLT